MLVVLALVVVAAGCGEDSDVGDERATQVREAALDAGLESSVADFLALAARGPTATYQATYPGPEEGTDLVVANDPPDRRVDVLVDDETVEVRLVLDGEAFECARDEASGGVGDCSRTDAIVEPPGLFGDSAVDELTESLVERSEDFTFSVQTIPVAGVEATCLVTELREGRERPELGDRGTLCLSPEGVLLRVVQRGEELEATDYTTEVPDGTFVRPDRRDGD